MIKVRERVIIKDKMNSFKSMVANRKIQRGKFYSRISFNIRIKTNLLNRVGSGNICVLSVVKGLESTR